MTPFNNKKCFYTMFLDALLHSLSNGVVLSVELEYFIIFEPFFFYYFPSFPLKITS